MAGLLVGQLDLHLLLVAFCSFVHVVKNWESFSGLKTGMVVCLKSSTDGGTKHSIEGIMISSPEFLFNGIIKLSISEKSPLWKVFLSRTPVHYKIL